MADRMIEIDGYEVVIDLPECLLVFTEDELKRGIRRGKRRLRRQAFEDRHPGPRVDTDEGWHIVSILVSDETWRLLQQRVQEHAELTGRSVKDVERQVLPRHSDVVVQKLILELTMHSVEVQASRV